MGSIAGPVAIAVIVTLTFAVIAVIVAARIYDYGPAIAANTALLLVSRGEFELILASLAVAAGLERRIAPFAALYVLVLSILSPLSSARIVRAPALVATAVLHPAATLLRAARSGRATHPNGVGPMSGSAPARDDLPPGQRRLP